MKDLDIARLQGLVSTATRMAQAHPSPITSPGQEGVVEWLNGLEGLREEQLLWLLVALPGDDSTQTMGQLRRGIEGLLVVRGVREEARPRGRPKAQSARWVRRVGVWLRRRPPKEKLADIASLVFLVFVAVILLREMGAFS